LELRDGARLHFEKGCILRTPGALGPRGCQEGYLEPGPANRTIRDGANKLFEDYRNPSFWKPEAVGKKEEQIGTRQDESQWIVAQRPLSAPTIPRFDTIVCRGFPHSMMRTALNTDPFNGKQGTCDISRSSYICSCSHGVEEEHSMSAWILA
jgi:hypothetical protein